MFFATLPRGHDARARPGLVPGSTPVSFLRGGSAIAARLEGGPATHALGYPSDCRVV
jgi:hypothetical protein